MTSPSFNVHDAMAVAVGHHQAGRLDQAAAIYRQIVASAPHPEALRLLGVVALQTGDANEAVALICRSLAEDPANPFAHNNLGEAYRMRNERNLAAACFGRAISLKPDFVEAFYNLARVHAAGGRHEDASLCYQNILRLRPQDGDAHFELGNTYFNRLQFADARFCFEQALRFKPNFAEAHNNMGKSFQLEGDLDRAIACYRTAAEQKPDFPLPHLNLGMAFQEQGNLAAASVSLQKALALNPKMAEAHNRLGVVFHAEGRFAEARACYANALALEPHYASAHLNLGNTLFAQRRFSDAEISYRNALRANPDLAQAYANLGYIQRWKGEMQAAKALFAEAIARNPDFVEAHWAFALSGLPTVYGADEDQGQVRAEFATDLGKLEAWFDDGHIADGYRAVGTHQPYFLAYQEEDNRALLTQYGDLCARLMHDWWQKQQITVPSRRTANDGPIRLGIVSAHVGDHSVWNAIGKGWIRQMRRDRFSLHVFHTGKLRDAETEFVRSHATHFEQAPHDLRGWVDAILGQQVDVLIYPEIGMDPMASKLANLRLAPVQAASWGHPETTGFPTIDYYISAQQMEPVNAEANYRERLVKLPNLGCCFEPLELPDVDVDFAAMGIAPDIPLLLCPGAPFKYAPRHDAVLTTIARGMQKCQLVFSNDPISELSVKLRRRLESAFDGAGLDPDAYLKFIPFQPRPAFRRLLARADVFLDTIGFSGFNTAMQAVECALPMVTSEGRFLRGRFGSGILRRIGMDEWVAASDDEYAAMAVRLGRSAQLRQQVRAQMVARRDVLFGDIAPVRALEAFLEQVTRPG